MSCDPVADNKAFREKFEFPYDLLSDVDMTMSRDYGAAGPDAARTARVSVLIDPDGLVAAVYPKVTPASHADEVLADLAALA